MSAKFDRPGVFRATCRLTLARPESTLTPEERQAAKADNYRRTYRTDLSKPRWETHFPQCDGFETTDPAAYLEHMATVHGRKPRGPRMLKLGNGRWRTPTPKPLDTTGLKTCGSCGLVAEVDERPANVLWWDEHLRGCALAQAAS